MTNFSVQPSHACSGILQVPGDKSISHRSIMFGAVADGTTEVDGFLTGADCLATLAAFRALGVTIEQPEPRRLVIHGVGMHGLLPPAAPLDLGNSGTAMRLLVGLLAGQKFDATLTGDESLNGRPMARVTQPLASMGARIATASRDTAPLSISGGQSLVGIDYSMPMASAQVKSCLLLAGLYAQGATRVTEPATTRDHTERMLQGFGYSVQRDGATVELHGGGRLTGGSVAVPGDISSAAFFLVAASIAPEADLTLTAVGVNPTRTGVIEILRLMGANIELRNERLAAGEPVADIRVRAAPLRGVRIPEPLVPLAIDEFPALFVAAACAAGETVLTGAGELRVKESDRIQAMADGLVKLGVDARPQPDGIRIGGAAADRAPGSAGRWLGGGEIDSHGDHRIAMAFAVAALRASDQILIHDCANVATSFPDFVTLASRAGIAVQSRNS